MKILHTPWGYYWHYPNGNRELLYYQPEDFFSILCPDGTKFIFRFYPLSLWRWRSPQYNFILKTYSITVGWIEFTADFFDPLNPLESLCSAKKK